ncbi:MAG: hypothetical protein K0B01_06015 [Syntrophobacterales bacterium]|nr:hypothetical protein [Syntrophobacterales bacterium]
MEISEYILNGNIYGIWLVCLFWVGYLLIIKIDLKHPRVLPKLIIAVILFGIPTLFSYLHYPWQMILISSFTVFPIVILLFTSIFWPLPHELIFLFWLKKKKLNKHLMVSNDLENRFSWILLTTPGKIQFLTNLISYYSRTNLSKYIHQCILNYARLPLFKAEKTAFELDRGVSYIQMGATSKVEQILEEASASFKRTSKYFFLLACVGRCKGLFDKERVHFEKALHLQGEDDSLKCQIYNNIAVCWRRRENVLNLAV